MTSSHDEALDDDTGVLEALEAHYLAHPEARPTLAEVTIAYAEQEGLPLARRPGLIVQAARS